MAKAGVSRAAAEKASLTPEQVKQVASSAEKPAVEEPPKARSLKDLQKLAARGGDGESMVNVQLLIDGSDADGVRCYNEQLPAALVRAILDPQIADFFIPIKGSERMKSPRVKAHWLHTSYIREVLQLDELPG